LEVVNKKATKSKRIMPNTKLSKHTFLEQKIEKQIKIAIYMHL
jgi:hypothetical protein